MNRIRRWWLIRTGWLVVDEYPPNSYDGTEGNRNLIDNPQMTVTQRAPRE